MKPREGITPYKAGKFRVDIIRGLRPTFVGIYDTREAAQAAYDKAHEYLWKLETQP